jgi:hypothetical protein
MLRVELEGSHGAHCAGLSADSVMGLARKLIAAGHPDQPFACYRGGMKCLTFKSLAWAARHTIREEPALRVEKYKKCTIKNSKRGTATGTHSPITGTPLQPETLPEA